MTIIIIHNISHICIAARAMINRHSLSAETLSNIRPIGGACLSIRLHYAGRRTMFDFPADVPSNRMYFNEGHVTPLVAACVRGTIELYCFVRAACGPIYATHDLL